MKIISHLSEYDRSKEKKLILTMGAFDGLHVGHQKVLKAVLKRAKKINGTAGVFTFWKHPKRVLRKKNGSPEIITWTWHKLELLEQMGIDICFLVNFTKTFSSLSPEGFVRDILVKTLGVKEVIIGYNFHFGKGKKGNPKLMTELAEKYGFGCKIIQKQKRGKKWISSTEIRSLIRKGKLRKAESYIGRPYTILGTTVKGRRLGRKLGFPTANLDPHNEALPPKGVYVVKVREVLLRKRPIHGGIGFKLRYKSDDFLHGLMNLGRRPTVVNAKTIMPEIFLFDFKGDLYGKVLEVYILKKLRDEQQFSNISHLREQIKKDIQKALRYLKSTKQLRSI